MSRNEHRPMSIDAMLDMERQDVLALLESKNQGSVSPERERIRSSSPYAAAPHSPVRSMLDIEEEEPGDVRTAPVTQAPSSITSRLNAQERQPHITWDSRATVLVLAVDGFSTSEEFIG
ncbi:universal stress protein [Purpureocillium lavendulum]|uniref:Universal stress protein n=1 Tax=Purpureocillium lavendulum TaxID=1247861 RepID=A0AB34FSK0_9HYPO|nr:universal stress protein [Purpureocillium lavendulum]